MKLSEVSLPGLVTEVRRLAANPPNDTAGRCRYYGTGAQGKPVCVIGHALAAQGFTKADMDAIAHDLTRGLNGAGLDRWPWNAEGDDDLEWLIAVQDAADSGHSWDEAVTQADTR